MVGEDCQHNSVGTGMAQHSQHVETIKEPKTHPAYLSFDSDTLIYNTALEYYWL